MAPQITVEKVNARLLEAGVKIEVRTRGNSISLRSSFFPPNPNTGSTRAQIALSKILGFPVNVNPNTLRRAEEEAHILWGKIIRHEFSWNDYLSKEEGGRRKEFVKNWEELIRIYHQHYINTGKKNSSWRHVYGYLKKLTGEVACESILKAALSYQPNTIGRNQACRHYLKLSEFFDLDEYENIKNQLLIYKGNKKNKNGELKNIPTESEIIAGHARLLKSIWGYVYDLIAVYGLRPHEAFFTKVDEEYPYKCHVLEGKTGARISYPYRPEWAAEWKIWEVRELPKFNKDWDYRDYGARVSTNFVNRKVGFSPYKLRHAYAHRIHTEYKVPVSIGALYMGHSPEIHLSYYQRWISEREADSAYLNSVSNYNRTMQ